jgi:hypothetical protein
MILASLQDIGIQNGKQYPHSTCNKLVTTSFISFMCGTVEAGGQENMDNSQFQKTWSHTHLQVLAPLQLAPPVKL